MLENRLRYALAEKLAQLHRRALLENLHERKLKPGCVEGIVYLHMNS
jgi:hypothetical protein